MTSRFEQRRVARNDIALGQQTAFIHSGSSLISDDQRPGDHVVQRLLALGKASHDVADQQSHAEMIFPKKRPIARPNPMRSPSMIRHPQYPSTRLPKVAWAGAAFLQGEIEPFTTRHERS